jgi:hypothetical protein
MKGICPTRELCTLVRLATWVGVLHPDEEAPVARRQHCLKPLPHIHSAAASAHCLLRQSTSRTKKGARMNSKGQSGVAYIVGGVVVFIICSVIQGIGDSSMFSTQYYKPDNLLLELLMNVTFWPGWLATAGLIICGVAKIINNRSK